MLQTYKNNFEIADLEMGGYFLLQNPKSRIHVPAGSITWNKGVHQ